MRCIHYKTNRKKRKAFYLRLSCAIFLAVCLLALTIFVAAGERAARVALRRELYFVCSHTVYREDLALSVSDVVSSGGGAGYLLHRGKGYAVVYSVYRTKSSAEAVCANLVDGGQNAEVLPFVMSGFYLPASDASAAAEIASYFRVYYDCIVLLSKTADELDAGRINREGAFCSMESAKDALTGLQTILEGEKTLSKARYDAMNESVESACGLLAVSDGLFASSDIRAIYACMSDLYMQTAQKLQK